MAKIQLNYFDGSSYIPLYPQVDLSNNDSTAVPVNQIPGLAASKITSGTFSTDRIPSLPASKITAGTFGTTGGEYVFPSNVRIKNNTNYGMKLNFGDGDYVYFYETTDDSLEIKASNLNFLVSGNLTHNGAAIGGGGGLKVESKTYNGTGSGSSYVTLNFSNTPIIVFLGGSEPGPLTLVNSGSGGTQKSYNNILHSLSSSSGQWYGRYYIRYSFSGNSLQWKVSPFFYGSSTEFTDAEYAFWSLNESSTSYWAKSLYL